MSKKVFANLDIAMKPNQPATEGQCPECGGELSKKFNICEIDNEFGKIDCCLAESQTQKLFEALAKAFGKKVVDDAK